MGVDTQVSIRKTVRAYILRCRCAILFGRTYSGVDTQNCTGVHTQVLIRKTVHGLPKTQSLTLTTLVT